MCMKNEDFHRVVIGFLNKGWSQKDLAKELGLSQSTISRLQNPKMSVSNDIRVALCKFMQSQGLTFNDFDDTSILTYEQVIRLSNSFEKLITMGTPLINSMLSTLGSKKRISICSIKKHQDN